MPTSDPTFDEEKFWQDTEAWAEWNDAKETVRDCRAALSVPKNSNMYLTDRKVRSTYMEALDALEDLEKSVNVVIKSIQFPKPRRT